MRHEKWYVLAFIAFVILIGVVGTLAARRSPQVHQYYGNGSGPGPAKPIQRPTVPPPVEEPSSNQAACEAGGGTYNPCGSACPDAPAGTACIQMCVERCEYPDGTTTDYPPQTL